MIEIFFKKPQAAQRESMFSRMGISPITRTFPKCSMARRFLDILFADKHNSANREMCVTERGERQEGVIDRAQRLCATR